MAAPSPRKRQSYHSPPPPAKRGLGDRERAQRLKLTCCFGTPQRKGLIREGWDQESDFRGNKWITRKRKDAERVIRRERARPNSFSSEKKEERCFSCSSYRHKELFRPLCTHQDPGKTKERPRALVEVCKLLVKYSFHAGRFPGAVSPTVSCSRREAISTGKTRGVDRAHAAGSGSGWAMWFQFRSSPLKSLHKSSLNIKAHDLTAQKRWEDCPHL